MASKTQRESPTFIEQARRSQLIELTISLVAEQGYAATSLASIAHAAGLTKGAVLYHFSTKDAVVAAAYEAVLTALVTDVGANVAAADVPHRPAAYVRAMIGYLREHPHHTRMLTQARSLEPEPTSTFERWGPLEELMVAARRAHGLTRAIDTRSLAIAVGGGIDAIVTERLADSSYSTESAAETLVTMLEGALLIA